MRLSGKVQVPSIKIGEVQVEGPIHVEYDTTFEPSELLDVISIVKDLPDVVAEMFRKVQKYQAEFEHTEFFDSEGHQISREEYEARKAVNDAVNAATDKITKEECA